MLLAVCSKDVAGRLEEVCWIPLAPPFWPDDVVEVPRPTAEAASKVLVEACEAHENGENQREARGSKMGASFTIS